MKQSKSLLSHTFMQIMWYLTKVILYTSRGELAPITLFESVNERQKIEPVPIPLPRASRNFPDADGQDLEFFLRCQKLHF